MVVVLITVEGPLKDDEVNGRGTDDNCELVRPAVEAIDGQYQ